MIYQSTDDTRTGWLLAASLVVAALALGLIGGLSGWEGQTLLLVIGLPAVLLMLNYRLGLILAILLLPFTNAEFLPRSGSLTVINVLLLGISCSFFLHWLRAHMAGRRVPVPIERELIVWYWLPITVGMVIGTMHLGEISIHYMRMNGLVEYGFKEYWVGFYLKAFLMVAACCFMGAAVVENGGKAMRYVAATAVSGVIFVVAIVVVVVSTGATLQQLQNERGLLEVLGRQNNEAGVLLLCAAAPLLFMREYVQHRMGRLLLLLAVFVMVAGLLLTMSRGGVLGFMVVVVYFVWYFRRPAVIFGTIAAVVIGFALTPAAIQDRMLLGLEGSAGRPIANQAAGNPAQDKLTMGRLWIWQMVASEIPKSPVYGRGVTSTQWSSAAKSAVFNHSHPHSVVLEVLMDLGVVGAICISMFYWFVWRSFRRLAADERVPPVMRGYFIGAGAGLIGMMVYNLTNGHYYPSPEQIFFWVSVGLAFGYNRWIKQQAAVPTAPAGGPGKALVMQTSLAGTGTRRPLVPTPGVWRPR